MKIIAVATGRDEALIARYGGNPADAERALRIACDQLRALGETAALSLEAGELADALYALGRIEDAQELIRECAQLAQAEDVSTQSVYHRVQAKLLARAGAHDEARKLAREAIELAGTRLEELGDGYLDLAEVERIGGQRAQAAEALERAVTVYEQKGSCRWPSARAASLRGCANGTDPRFRHRFGTRRGSGSGRVRTDVCTRGWDLSILGGPRMTIASASSFPMFVRVPRGALCAHRS